MSILTLALVFLTGPAWAGDKDGDGVPNKTDTCKEEVEDADGFEDEDGCPDPDNDADGVLDAADKCPNEPEDKDNHDDADGCPDPDNDGDGVLDAADKCPDEKEGDDVKDGCVAVTYEVLNGEGWVPALKTLNDALSAGLTTLSKPPKPKRGEPPPSPTAGCDAVSSAAEEWFKANDATKLHAQFVARSGRVMEGVDPSIPQTVLDAQATFWASASKAFEIYCKDHGAWPALQPKIDAVYAKAKK
jgi:hypothetical protein